MDQNQHRTSESTPRQEERRSVILKNVLDVCGKAGNLLPVWGHCDDVGLVDAATRRYLMRVAWWRAHGTLIEGSVEVGQHCRRRDVTTPGGNGSVRWRAARPSVGFSAFSTLCSLINTSVVRVQ